MNKKTLITLAMVIAGIINTAAAKSIAVLSLDNRCLTVDKSLVTLLTRTEISKIPGIEMLDRYEMEEQLAKGNFKDSVCFSKTCLVSAGKILGVQSMFTGTLENYLGKILITFREIDVNANAISKSASYEYLDNAANIKQIISASVRRFYGQAVSEEELKNLTDPTYLPGGKNNPNTITMSTGGPRFGMTYFTGNAADWVTRPKSEGGLDGYPVMFQFGYQFEKQYLNEGNLQGLIEFLPMITGADQGRFSPSFTLLNGFRSQRSGWEFAFGPSLTWAPISKGYYNNSGAFIRTNTIDSSGTPLTDRLDTRGTITPVPSFLVAVGKTFKSGRLNMPINCWVRPSKNNLQFGLSWGFNMVKRKAGDSIY